ncbi:MAG: P44/Msp2 family outer membrane protein, partial [Anaplasma sp.]|nr:P44/Msp2 family outer membrane protein [Anaplasma sp.]
IIDGKVCSGTHAQIDGNNATTYDAAPGKTEAKTAQCSGLKTSGVGDDQKLLSKFVSLTGIGEGKNWPTGQAGNTTAAKIGPTNSNATAVAKDIVKELTPEEKTIVAGLLAKTIEGGEVVEI